MSADFQVRGTNERALFTLTLHRGEGMLLLAMNWKNGRPPDEFAGFAIEYMEPGGNRFFTLKNRLSFPDARGRVSGGRTSTLLAPVQKFRWVHFPRHADMNGEFTYRVTPVFMNDHDELSYGEAQTASIELRRDTYPGSLNVAFTRGFVSSQAFVDRYEADGPVKTLLPSRADRGLDFTPTHPKWEQALDWMGFEARREISAVLDRALADSGAQVSVVAYDLNEPELVERLEKLGGRLRIIIDDSGAHGRKGSAENAAAERLAKSAGADRVKRQHVSGLQHNKTVVVDGPQEKTAVCGSTNFSWRGLFVQANNALILHGEKAIRPFLAAFENYWTLSPSGFASSEPTGWTPLGIETVDAQVTFSPHASTSAKLAGVAEDMADHTASSLFFSLAFLYQTPGPIRDAVTKLAARDDLFVYGISDRAVGGLDLQKPGGDVGFVRPAALKKGVPEPFKAEPTGGAGVRMHHKFVVVDFNTDAARVYSGSYNFSSSADTANGENLLLIRDRRVATAYAVEAVRLFDHYHFRMKQDDMKRKRESFALRRPPRTPGEAPWWLEDYTDVRKIKDRELFA
ncbi:MAG: hypothetical protein JXD23_10240 [Spirochaetales bacterium]|nr:hypothetical protein [Spirochaetales bacterium]